MVPRLQTSIQPPLFGGTRADVSDQAVRVLRVRKKNDRPAASRWRPDGQMAPVLAAPAGVELGAPAWVGPVERGTALFELSLSRQVPWC